MGSHHLIIHGMKRVLFVLILTLSACATHPPAQEMSDARSAIKTAQDLPGQTARADKYLQSAEQALEDAAAAIRQEHYDRARNKALEAKRHAQEAARLKQFPNK
ncbi:MAG: hypothetical protein AUJ57_01980 [Zetaproteobacteria bacterium CG1_02_53_45]|nr:MAG: hypothetical protein AUJ57_01980 [Zetaproteobacteria bacterium CG1_02_53_45]